ncbi:MAG: hypothetical protein AAF533_00430 [Acidobacteriota bacterium]
MKTTSLLTLATLVAFAGPALAQVGGTTGPSWPLSLPPPGPVLEMDDLHGAIVHVGGQDYQVDEAVLLMSPEGHFGFHHLSGYDSEGQPLSFTRPDDGSRLVESLDELHQGLLGDPADPSTLVRADLLVLGIDGRGRLVIHELVGEHVVTGRPVQQSSPGLDVEPFACAERLVGFCHDASCPGPCVEGLCYCSSDIENGCFPFFMEACAGDCPRRLQSCICDGSKCACEWDIASVPGVMQSSASHRGTEFDPGGSPAPCVSPASDRIP